MHKTFDYWLRKNRHRFNHVPYITKKTKEGYVFQFDGISSSIRGYLSKNSCCLLVEHKGEYWDFIWEEDIVFAQNSQRKLYCTLCQDDFEEGRRKDPPAFFDTKKEAIIDHIFKPLLEWVNKLNHGHHIFLYGIPDKTSWGADLIDINDDNERRKKKNNLDRYNKSFAVLATGRIIEKSAVISECGVYRYLLRKIWDDTKPYALFITLYPSINEPSRNDPTIMRCASFAKEWGLGGMCMVNLFACQVSQPSDIMATKEPIGSENNTWIIKASREAGITIAAWGNDGSYLNRANEIKSLIPNLKYLKLNSTEEPAHPLYQQSVSLERITKHSLNGVVVQ